MPGAERKYYVEETRVRGGYTLAEAIRWAREAREKGYGSRVFTDKEFRKQPQMQDLIEFRSQELKK